MLEALLTPSVRAGFGLKGTLLAAKKAFISGEHMTMSADGRYLASGKENQNNGTGEVWITDLINPSNPVVTKSIILSEWKPGGSVGVFTRAGNVVKGSDDLKTLAINSAYNGVDLGTVFITKLDASWNPIGSPTRILASNTTTNDVHGQFLDMNKDATRLAVAATGYGSSTGRVIIYLYISNNWVQEKILDRPAGETCFRFGYEVNMSRDGNMLVASSLPNTPGSSRVFLYKRAGIGAWDLVSTIADSRSITNTGKIIGYLSGDGKKLFVAYSYNTSTAGSPEGGVDIYDINPTTGATTLVQTVPNGIAGGGYGGVASVSYDGSTFLGALTMSAGNQYDALNCVQVTEPGGPYDNAWTYKNTDTSTYNLNSIIDQNATKWVSSCPLILSSSALNSFFVGK